MINADIPNTSSTSVVTVNAVENPAVRITGNGLDMIVLKTDTKTSFIGEVDNCILPKVIDVLNGTREKLLVEAVNNRTRERNYYRLYSQLLENQISDDDFDREIDEHPDEYVVSTDKCPTESEFYQAMLLSEHLKGTDTIGDIESLFSFKESVVLKHCKEITNGSI